MSRSSFSIRRLISPRPSPTVEEYRHTEVSNKSADLHLPSSRQRLQETKSWAPPRRSSNPQPERPSREDVLVRSSQSTKRIPGGVPRLQGSPHSSSTSLCSCECPTDTAPTTTGDGTLCCSPPQERNSRPSAPKRLAERRHLWISPLSPPPYDSVPGPSSTEADIKAREAGFVDISLHPALRGALTPPASPEEEEYGLDRWSPNVEHLIRETDEAFKAVGTAIEEAKMAVSNFPSPTEVGRTSTSSAPSPFTLDSPNFPHRKLQDRNSTPALSSAFGPTMPLAPKSRGKKLKKTAPKKSARRQLGEDVAGIISGQFFRKVEVDELLTPERLDELRLEREAQSKPRRSSDTLRTTSTDDSETPLEPFHLQDLASRIGAASVESTVPPADVVVPPSPLGSGEQLKPTLQRKSSRRKKPVTKKEYEAEGPLENVEVGVPPPPPAKNPARFLARPPAPLLPTIPEVIVTTPGTRGTPTDRINKTAARSFAPVNEGDFVFFQSTNYTLNHPMIRQGPIRFPRTEVVKGMKIDPDDTLDWTAFQMAILGGAGYLFSESTDFTQPPENEEAAELVAWFDGFGFDSPGLLITSEEPARSPKKSPATPELLYPSAFTSLLTESELPIPVGAEHPTGFWNEGAVNVSKIPKAGCGIRRWTMEGHPKRFTRESVGSLPPSPMMDLVMMRDSSGEPELVPMGYNLGHDLEDFLKWEAENVCVLGMH